MDIPFQLVKIAVFWGLISAVSLPIGATIGLTARPGKKITSALMAFGAGALLFALTIELFGQALHHVEEHGRGIILVTIAAAVAGGLFFDFLNMMLNNRGAFLRKFTTTKKYLTTLKTLMAKRVINELSQVTLLQALPPGDIVKLIPRMKREVFEPDEVLFREGDVGSTLYFISSGEVEISRKGEDGKDTVVAVLKDNDTFGEMALLSRAERNATARAQTRTEVLEVLHSDFDSLLSESETLRDTVQELFDHRAEELSKKSPGYGAGEWKNACLKHLEHLQIPLTDQEIDQATQEAARAKGAALAIWLGILLDGIPESLIIGMLSASAAGISLAFIAGVFLANLPEAMSSSVGMRRSGMGVGRVLWMWSSLCIITGIGAVVGVLIFPAHPTGAAFFWIAGIEGLAAGAMLTMIAETMLPEAFEQGGAIVGLSTLIGFLTALVVKVL
ncbi:MAG: cyclic nucleotide-binding domain-containing protein [Candidatus Latescibacteria bacterium]|nr:cyclic nucleotide-binding domain-containing protein [Candidatus Latescibacterota bacterium]